MRNMSTTILRYLNSISAKLSFFMVLERHSVMQRPKRQKRPFLKYTIVNLNSKIQKEKNTSLFLINSLSEKKILSKNVWSRSTEKCHFGGRGYKYCKCQWSSAAWSNNSGRYYMTNRTYILSKTKMQRQTIQGTK